MARELRPVRPAGRRSRARGYYYLWDALGSTAAIANPAGALDNSYEYDPYGNQTASTGTLSNYFKFAGGFSLADRSGGDLYHFGARYYDPATGRWDPGRPARPDRRPDRGQPLRLRRRKSDQLRRFHRHLRSEGSWRNAWGWLP
jgi:RHS repeat-associated protein